MKFLFTQVIVVTWLRIYSYDYQYCLGLLAKRLPEAEATRMTMVMIDGKIDEAYSPGGEATRMTMVIMVTIDCNLICPATLPHSVQTISS